MSEEKLGQHYLAALNEAFPGVVLDHAWQTKDQLTGTWISIPRLSTNLVLLP